VTVATAGSEPRLKQLNIVDDADDSPVTLFAKNLIEQVANCLLESILCETDAAGSFRVQRTYVLSQRPASERWTQRTRPAALLRESFSVPPTARDNFAIKVAPVEQSVNVSQLTHWLLLIKNSSVRTDASELHHSHLHLARCMRD
jgi:hypothetical protein